MFRRQWFAVQPSVEIGDVIGKFGWPLIGQWVEGIGGAPVRARRPAQAKIDATVAELISERDTVKDLLP